jgi:uncharacterized membrane protein HdeD (DUF308 family)
MMETRVAELREGVRRQTGWTIAVGIGLIVAGVVALRAPKAGAVVATLMFGWVAIGAGILEGIEAWSTRKERGAFWRFALSAAYLAVGIYSFARPTKTTMALALAFGLVLVARGIFLAAMSYELRSTHSWGWVLFDGIVSALFGALVLARWPNRSVMLLGVFVGVSLLMNGLDHLMVAGEVRRHLPPPSRPAHPLGAAGA